VVRPPCDPSDRTDVGHEGDGGGRTVECAPIRAGRLPSSFSGAGTLAGLPRRVVRLLHPPRGCVGRPDRCAAERSRTGPFPAAVEPGAGPPARLGEPVRGAGVWADRRRAAARPAGRLPATSRSAGVRRGRDRLAALRCRVLARAWPVLSPLPAFGRPADRRRLGLAVDLPAQLRPRLLDRSGGRSPAAAVGRHRSDRCRPDPRAAGSSARWRAPAPGRLGRRRRLRPAIPRPRRPACGGGGAAAI
jgi:hypothetical protein